MLVFFHRYIREIRALVTSCAMPVHIILIKEINHQVGVSMWQTLDLGETFGTFCQVTGTAGVVSYILVIFHLELLDNFCGLSLLSGLAWRFLMLQNQR